MLKKQLILILMLMVVATPLFSRAAEVTGSLQEAIEARNRELEAVTKQIEETQATLQATSAKGKTLKQEIGTIDKNLKTVTLGIKQSEIVLDKLGLEIVSLGEDIKAKEEAVVQKRVAVQSIIKNLQAKDNESLLMSFLKSKSLTESLRDVQSLADLNSQLLTEVASLREVKAELIERKQDVTLKKGSVETEKKTLQVKKSIVEEEKQTRAQILAATQNQEKAYQQQLSELEKRQDEISEEIGRIEADLRKAGDAGALPGKRPGVLGYPIASPRKTQDYGATAFAQRAYKTKFHNGMDFAAPIGTPVLAAADGTVTSAGNNGRVQYGKFILLKHENNLSTLYAHLSRQAVSAGQTVKKGDIIGYSGNTGYSTGPHLHFTVYLSASVLLKSIAGAGLVPVGYTLNPADYL